MAVTMTDTRTHGLVQLVSARRQTCLNSRNLALEYGKHMATPSLPAQRISPWKRLAVVSFFIGVGIAVVLCSLLAGVYWYTTRPPKWNTHAIQASYKQSGSYVALEDWYQKQLAHRAQTTEPEDPAGWVSLLGTFTLKVSYDLKNSTDSDYTLETPDASGLVPMLRLRSNGSMVDAKGLKWSVAEPLNHLWMADHKTILIPAHQAVRVVFAMDYQINGDDRVATTVADWAKQENRSAFGRHLISDADAFVLLDAAHHYEIDLPLNDAMK